MPLALAERSCTPCRGGMPPLTREEAAGYHAQAPDWELVDEGRRIERSYRFKNFRDAFAFVERAAELAEAERDTIPQSASAGVTRRSRSIPRRSRGCTRTTSSWRQSSTASPPRERRRRPRTGK